MPKVKANQRTILSITIHQEVDTDPDLSWLGEYTNQADWPDNKYVIDREKRGDSYGRHEYRYFVSSDNYNDEKPRDRKRYTEQDYKRMEAYNNQQWCMVGLWAEAVVQFSHGGPSQKIRSGGLWGIESDSDDGHLAEVQDEQVGELRNELKAVGFTDRQIDKALESVKKVGD